MNAGKLPIEVSFNSIILPAVADLPLLGPGDIIGLDPNVIVRTWPRPNEDDAEFGHFPLIELDQTDLPWRYTPAKENAAQQLRPWLTLVVVEDINEATFVPAAASKPLASIKVNSGTALPDPAQAWAWAHAQVEGTHAGGSTASIIERIRGDRGLALARLVCPRVLEPSKQYIACLVPTFERGRRVGLGEALGDVGGLEPAWTATTSEVELPVYYHWRFRTGTSGSFQQLVRQITVREIPDDVGTREISVAKPGFGLPAVSSQPFRVGGALQSIAAAQEGLGAWPEADRSAFISALQELLQAGTHAGSRVVVPPLYGQWYAGQSRLDQPQPAGENPPWFHTLNSDPRFRVAAALGTAVIQREQQALLASGWKQVGDLNAANAWLKYLQLGRETSLRLFTRHVTTGDVLSFLTFTARLHGRIICNGKVVCEEHRETRIGRELFGLQWRRFTRPFGLTSLMGCRMRQS